jgi:hypothetical protein
MLRLQIENALRLGAARSGILAQCPNASRQQDGNGKSYP